ncbi:MAG: hypothetical protein IJU62_04270 [Muribaculaceae bacterium]|nr:hypothetical protein [Muribaculaceae bacterium]
MRTLIKNITLILLCSIPLEHAIYSQNVQDIKNSGAYVWGEGMGVSLEEAEEMAMSRMCKSISVDVFHLTSREDNNRQLTDRDVQLTLTTARLQNVQTRTLAEEPEFRVLCFMSRDEVARIYDARAKRVIDLVQSGKRAEERLQIDDALRCYYWALLLSRTNPNPIQVSFLDKKGDATILLYEKINSVIKQIKAEVTDGVCTNETVKATIHFTYNGKDISTLQFRYNDGQHMVGPEFVRDGVGEVDLVSVPSDKMLHISYETQFRNDIDPLDSELAGLYTVLRNLPSFNSLTQVPFKQKGKEIKAVKPSKKEIDIENDSSFIMAQTAIQKKPIALREVQDVKPLLEKIHTIEMAIESRNAKIASDCFTVDGYKLFHTLLNETGRVTLVGKSDYEFVEADGYLVGRATQIKIKFKNGKSFIENIVYRFDAQSGKISSIAFRLTKTAENDIMNAAAQWPEVSRWAILSFMEDYQTAFALKRLDYISSIFSEDAIIITGTVIKKANTSNDFIFNDNRLIQLNPETSQRVKYSQHTKSEYIQKLGRIFDRREYVHLTFEDNITQIIDLPIVSRGAAFGIEIKQRYTTPTYSDEGYLTLAFDTRGEHPLIHVRFWQPNKNEMMSLQQFISLFAE